MLDPSHFKALMSCIQKRFGERFMPINDSPTGGQSEKTFCSMLLLLAGAGVVASFQVGKAPPVLPAVRMELG
jgi:hypothetical protein